LISHAANHRAKAAGIKLCFPLQTARDLGPSWEDAVDQAVTVSAVELRSWKKRFIALIWRKTEVPVTEILVHAIVTILSILSIAAIELILNLVKLGDKNIPFTTITLSQWMFYLEILAATLIILIGTFKAVIALARLRS
jgi:hypothetical protein